MAACRVGVLGTGGGTRRGWRREDRVEPEPPAEPAAEGIARITFRQGVAGQGGVVRIPGERVQDIMKHMCVLGIMHEDRVPVT